jgi:hypothetical protein
MSCIQKTDSLYMFLNNETAELKSSNAWKNCWAAKSRPGNPERLSWFG